MAVAISLAMLGAVVGFAVAFVADLNPGLGLLIGAGVGVVACLPLLFKKMQARRRKEHEAILAGEAAVRAEKKRRYAEAEASGAFDRFEKVNARPKT